MLARPSTDEILADCCRELTDHILPALTDETLQVRVAMIETVLRNAAVRTAHEIAWLREETETLLAYAGLASTPPTSLHLADVIASYEAAGHAFDSALAAAQDANDTERVAAAREILRVRVEHEKQVMATYAVVGR